MAEGVFRHLTRAHPGGAFHIDSAGTGAYHAGAPPDPRTASTLVANGITDYRHRARKITAQDFERFDFILGMDEENLENLRRMRGRIGGGGGGARGEGEGEKGGTKMGRLELFGDYGGRKGEVVVDPYYGGRDGFDVAYEQMVRFSKGFLKAHGRALDGDDA
ncbi:MAG: hypothetical protein M1819_003559 [Sarea resinae]|nr:MAG: hypothetical protein M1819_003559 [Sarea resinae]